MALNVISISREKYLGMDTITFHLTKTAEVSFVDEYDVPPFHEYTIMYSQEADTPFKSWVQLINPQKWLDTSDRVVPYDMKEIIIDGKTYSFYDAVKLLINYKKI